MYEGYAFGLRINADVPISILSPTDENGDADVIVRQKPLPEFPEVDTDTHYIVRNVADDGIRFATSGRGRFLISGGNRIWYEPAPGVTPQSAISTMLPMCLGVIMFQRGLLTLHASAVRIGDVAVGIVAHKGTGKSTTCANLHARGHSLITDDVLALKTCENGRLWAIPAFPTIKMRPDAVPSLGITADDLPRVDPTYERRKLDASATFSREPVPLARVYLLQDGPEVSLEPLSGIPAMLELLTHSYIVRLLGQHAAGPDHLQDCKRIVDQVGMRRAISPRGLEHLPTLLDLIEEDVRSDERTEPTALKPIGS